MAPGFSKLLEPTRMSCEECWVTLAHDEKSAIRALVLSKSLRRVVTTRKVAVIICEGVPESFRKILHSAFDQCLNLNMPHVMNGAPARFYAKIFCWSLPFIKKCVFLDSNSLVLKNCDELFQNPGKVAFVADERMDTSTLILEPSFDDYTDLCDWMRTGKLHVDGVTLDMKFGEWLMSRKGFRKLPSKYNVEINPKDGYSSWNEANISIIRFTSAHPIDMMEEYNIPEKPSGVLEQALVKYWKQIYVEEVIDLIKNPAVAASPYQRTNPAAFPGISQNILDGNKEPIAIVGMSCRFPQADNAEEFWEHLMNGKDCITKVPEDRWPSTTKTEFREVQAGFLKCGVDEFDGKFFNISPFELAHTDPQQRLLLEVSYEALEHAGIDPQSLIGSNTGIFVGTWTQDYRDLIKDVNGGFSDFHRIYMGNSLGGTSGRLSFFGGFTGPNIASESGCSSGMVAVYLACKSLRDGQTDLALAAGANLLLHPFEKRHMVNVASPDGRCKTFDASADGFGRGEGVATLVLKRYSDAVKAGDNILALIRGCGLSQEGTSRSFGTPTKDVQEIALKAALDDAGVDASEVSFVEAHGTGTIIGDTTEMAAISDFYCKEKREIPLLVASVKPNIGHTESCSGIAGIIKVILSMQHETIPAHINLNNLNPHINLTNIPIRIPKSPERWETSPEYPIRIAGVSSFGITGTNAHLIIQEAPKYSLPTLELPLKDRPFHLLTFSAKSENSLDNVLETFSKFLEKNSHLPLGDLAYTLNSGRAHYAHRVATVVSTVPELLKKLKTLPQGKCHTPEVRPEICFLFTGQGSQYFGMGKVLYETNPSFRMNFDKCNRILEELYGLNLTRVLWNEDDGKIHQSLYSQTAIFCIEYCLMELWKSWGIFPDAVMGHSLGEFSSAVCAGILYLEDALKLVYTRSRLIQEKCPKGNMVAVKGDKDQVSKILQTFLEDNSNLHLDYAAFNSTSQTVLAGSEESVRSFSDLCEARGLKTKSLNASNAFHSRDMDCILEEYEKVAKTITYRQPQCPYISGVTGDIVSSDEINPSYWRRHTREPVLFSKASKTASEKGYRVYLEIGPQPILCALKMANETEDSNEGLPDIFLSSLRRNENNWVTMFGSLMKLYELGFDIDWKGIDQFCGRKKCHLPTYPFNRKKHWYESKSQRQSLMFNTDLVHPLLGCQIPNATSTSIFQAAIDLEKVPYLKDHKISENIVFPAAGFLELCLSSGYLSTTGQLEIINPMSVENLIVEAPLGMVQGEQCVLQTVVSREENGDQTVSIYAQSSNQDASKWFRHATAGFFPLQVNYNLYDEMAKLEDLKTRCVDFHDTNEFYGKLEEVGLEFGKGFRSLDKLWKNPNNQEILAEIKIEDSGATEEEKYMAHPVLLDALIQALMISSERCGGSLYVPIVIGKVIIFSKSKASLFYAHSSWKENQSMETRSATLYDETGKILAVMSNVEMIETSSDNIRKKLLQDLEMPNLYEELWRPRVGPMKFRVELEALRPENLFSPEFSRELASCNHLTEELTGIVTNRKRLVNFYVIKAFYELGWKPLKEGEIIQVDDFMTQLGIIPCHKNLIMRYLTILVEDGILQEISPGSFKLLQVPMPLDNVEDEIRNCISFITNHPRETDDSKVAIGCGEKLSFFLSGKESALSFLFPEDKTKTVCAETFYNEAITVNAAHHALVSTVRKLMESYVQIPKEERGIIRFLEVGAGTGSTTRRVLGVFDEFQAKYQYTFTDISPAFFINAQVAFKDHSQKMQYKTLNVEEEPLAQGFIPGHYDIVMASNVLHATRNLRESVAHAISLLKPGGLLLLVETLQPIREYDVVFGLLDGFWRYNDLDIRPNYPTITGEMWVSLCRSQGFKRSVCFPCFGDEVGIVVAELPNISSIDRPLATSTGSWLVFSDSKVYPEYLKRKFEETGRHTIVVNQGDRFHKGDDGWSYEIRPSEKTDLLQIFKAVEESNINIEGILYLWGMTAKEGDDPIDITSGFLHLAQVLLSDFKGLPKVVLATEGMMPVAEASDKVEVSTLWGMVRCFRTEHFNLHVRAVDLDPYEDNLDLKYSELFTELWNDDHEYQIAYRDRSRHVCRLVQCKDSAKPLTLPNSDRFSLILPKTKNIADLKFYPNSRPTLGEKEVDVEVRATGLNFRDVFVVLKPSKEFESMNCLGLEFSGVVMNIGRGCSTFKVGDRVMGCKFADGALPSHIQIEEELLFKIPEGLTFAEASTLPACFATSYYCLVTIANMKEGETVLIHAGSGGVGLLAIQVAKSIGAKIIATAGSRRKQQFLRNLGIEHVFHSRNTRYSKEILKVTEGRGVDVVLNSLTSEGFKEATLNCCSKGARFVEMSKLHVWAPEEVKLLRPDVQYTIVDLANVGRETWIHLWGAIHEYWRDSKIQPIPYTRFEAQFIREALLYLQKAKHIGKIIVTMPSMVLRESRYEPEVQLFNSMSTYLVTGGLGGIGIELAKWMVRNGAKHLVLTSRRPPNEHASNAIESLRSEGCNIVVIQADVGDTKECEDLFKAVQDPKMRLPRLRGIFHAAGALSDATYVNQNLETFQKAFRGKVYGARNLHNLSQPYNLEFFTLFSSMVSILGPIGLANYAASNAYLDALCHYRNSIGLCGQSINWGQWAEVGAARDVTMPAVKPFKPSQGFLALDNIMKGQRTQVAVLDVDFSFVRKLTSNVGTYLEELEITKGSQGINFNAKIGNFWKEFEKAEGDTNKLSVIKSYIITILRQILKFDEDECIDDNVEFQSLGIDSLMMVEMKNFLQTMLGKNITLNVSEMAEYTTLNKLSNHLLFLISKPSENK